MTSSARRRGADPDALEHLAVALTHAGRTLADVAVHVERALGRSGWHGPAAAEFSRRWAGDRTRLRTAATTCAGLAGTLRQQADEQRKASDGRHAVGGTPRSAGAPERSRSESYFRIGGFVDAGPVEGRTAVRARVEALDGARSRVTVSDVVGVAGVAAAGATAEVRCGASTVTPVHPLRAEGEVAAGAEVEHRTVWEVPDDDVHRLLATEGAERAGAALGLGPLAAALARQLEPRPAGQELLLRATASASAVSPRPGVVGPIASAEATASVAVGLATAAGGAQTLVVEATDDAAATFQPGFLAALGLGRHRSATATWARLELPLGTSGGDGDQPVRLELRSTDAHGTVDRVVVHATLSGDAGARAVVDQVRHDLAAGRPPAQDTVDALLAGVTGSVAHRVVQVDQLEAVASGCSARAVGGAGVRVGGGGGVQVVNLLPRRR